MLDYGLEGVGMEFEVELADTAEVDVDSADYVDIEWIVLTKDWFMM